MHRPAGGARDPWAAGFELTGPKGSDRGLAALALLVTLGRLDRLAGEQHAARLLAKTAAYQADQARVALPGAAGG